MRVSPPDSRNFRLTYSDQNEEFASCLPRDGIISRLVRSIDGVNWAVFQLREQITFQENDHHYLLLRPRHGDKIDDWYPTPVFILLGDDVSDLADGFDSKRLRHVAWGDLLHW